MNLQQAANSNSENQAASVNTAFTKQSFHYDEEDKANAILQDMRKQVYSHLQRFLKPGSNILELNAGTGIDALHLVSLGHQVHATDVSDGMISQIERKIKKYDLSHSLTVQQLSFDALHAIKGKKFDYVFSDFGGLNCIQDLSKVIAHLPPLLTKNAYITWVIMPPVCLWEIAGIFKGNKRALRRFNNSGVKAHIDGEFFQTFYHSLSAIKSSFGPSFKFIRSEGLAALSPQPHRKDFPVRHPLIYKTLQKSDALVRDHFPFNRWADHIIVTFQYNP